MYNNRKTITTACDCDCDRDGRRWTGWCITGRVSLCSCAGGRPPEVMKRRPIAMGERMRGSMWSQKHLTLRRVDATALSAVPAGGSNMTDALSQTIAGLGGRESPHRRPSVCDWAAAGNIVVRSGIHSASIAINRPYGSTTMMIRCPRHS